MRNVKKLFAFFLIMMLLIILTVPVVFAAETTPEEMTGSYMTWEYLGTLSGAIAAVLLIVQFLKAPLDKIWKIPTRFVVYIIATIILLSVEYVLKGTLTFDRVGLILLNAIIVTIAAMGAYEATFHKLEIKKQT